MNNISQHYTLQEFLESLTRGTLTEC